MSTRSSSAHCTWLVWDRGTGRLLLEVKNVPVHLKEKTVAVTLAHFGYWPVDLDDMSEAIDSLSSEQIGVTIELLTPSIVLDQTQQATRKIEWRAMWTETKETNAAMKVTMRDLMRQKNRK